MYCRYYDKIDIANVIKPSYGRHLNYVPIYIDDQLLYLMEVYQVYIGDFHIDVFSFYGRLHNNMLLARLIYLYSPGFSNSRILILSSFVHIGLLNEKGSHALYLSCLPLNVMLLDVL